MSDSLTPDEEQQALEAIVRRQLQIKELEEEVDALKSFFKTNEDLYPAGTNKENGKFYIKVTSSTRVDDGLAKANLSKSVYDRLSKKVIDGPLAKRGLTPEDYKSIVKVYANRIEIGMK